MDDRTTFKILTGKSTGKIALERSRHRLEENITINL